MERCLKYARYLELGRGGPHRLRVLAAKIGNRLKDDSQVLVQRLVTLLCSGCAAWSRCAKLGAVLVGHLGSDNPAGHVQHRLWLLDDAHVAERRRGTPAARSQPDPSRPPLGYLSGSGADAHVQKGAEKKSTSFPSMAPPSPGQRRTSTSGKDPRCVCVCVYTLWPIERVTCFLLMYVHAGGQKRVWRGLPPPLLTPHAATDRKRRAVRASGARRCETLQARSSGLQGVFPLCLC